MIDNNGLNHINDINTTTTYCQDINWWHYVHYVQNLNVVNQEPSVIFETRGIG